VSTPGTTDPRLQGLLIEQVKGDTQALNDGTPQYWWSRVPEQQRLMKQRGAEVIGSRAAKKSSPKGIP